MALDDEPQGVEADETFGVFLVVDGVLFERGKFRIEEAVGRLASHDGDVAFVEFETYIAVDVFLGPVDGGLEHFALGGEPEAVVDHFGVAGHQLVLEVRFLAVEGDRFDGAVGLEHDRAAGGFVAAAALHADEAVLDQVEAADAVLASQSVELCEQLGGSHLTAVDRHRVARFVADGDVFGLVGGLFGADGPAPHILFRFVHRIFQTSALVGYVQEVRVHGVGGFLAVLLDGDAVGFGVGEQLFAAVEIPLSPGGDDRDVGIEGEISQLETHLVVAFARRAVADGIRTREACDLDLAFGDQRTGDGGAQEILALVDGIGPEHREDVVAHELLAQVLDEDIFGFDTEFQRLFSGRFDLFALADVGGEGDHFAVVLVLEPFENDTGVETAGVGEYDFFDLFFHLERTSSENRFGRFYRKRVEKIMM